MASSSDEFIGPYTREQNVKITDLLKPENFKENITINNGIIYEIRKNSSSDAAAAETVFHLGKSMGDRQFLLTNLESLRKKIQTVYSKTKLLRKKGRQIPIDEFCKLEFIPPSSKVEQLDTDDKTKQFIRNVQQAVSDVKQENLALKRGLEDKENEIGELNYEVEVLEKYIETSLIVLNRIQVEHRNAIRKFSCDKTKLEQETNKWKLKFETVTRNLDIETKKLDEAKTKLSRYNIRNVNKRHKRLENKYEIAVNEKKILEEQFINQNNEINELQAIVDEKQIEIEIMNDNLNTSNEKIQELKSEKHKLQKEYVD